MAIFSSHRDSYLTYYIVLTDAAAVDAYKKLYPNGVNRAPYNAGPPAGGAAVEFAAPWKGSVQPNAGSAPFSYTLVSGDGGRDGVYPIDVATFQRHNGGFLGIGGTTTRFFWMGMFQLANTAAGPAEPAPSAVVSRPILQLAPIAKRRWVEGFETPFNGPALLPSGNGSLLTRDAARSLGGLGLAMRGSSNEAGTIPVNAYTPGLATPNSWERFYLRVRQLPAATTSFWRCHGTPSVNAGVSLEITPTGGIAIYSVDAGGTKTLLTTVLAAAPASLVPWTGAYTDDAWHRVDLLLDYIGTGDPTTGAGKFRLYVDGLLLTTQTMSAAAGGLGVGTRHQSSSIGNNFSGANTLELDIDDWIGMDPPVGRTWDGDKFPNEYDINAGLAPHPPNRNAYEPGDVVFVSAEDHVYICIKENPDLENGTPTIRPPSLRTNAKYWHRYEGNDWLNGSRVQLTRASGFAASHNAGAWAGDFRTLEQDNFGNFQALCGQLVSTTSGAIAAVNTDVHEIVDTDPQSLGAVAVQVCALAARGTTDGLLGYSIAGSAPVMLAVAGANGVRVPLSVLFSPDGASTQPTKLNPLELRYQKGADSASCTLQTLLAQVEMLGLFGPQDWRPSPVAEKYDPALPFVVDDNVIEPLPSPSYYTAIIDMPVPPGGPSPPDAASWSVPKPPDYPHFIGQHNAPYLRSPWSGQTLAAPPGAAIVEVGGTYVGNGTGQDLTFREPVHLLWIRPLTGGTGGFFWSSTMMASHQASQIATAPNVAAAQQDLTFVPPALDVNGEGQQQRYRVRLGSLNAQINAVGITYQYIAFCDPAARFLRNSAFSHNAALATTVDNKIIDAQFAADWLFLVAETLDASTPKAVYAQGPTSAAAKLSNFGGTALAAALTKGVGVVSSQAALHALAADQFAVMLCRLADGNNDPNQASVWALGGYVGDGSASRTITMLATGKRPLFALFFGESGTGYWRDPSHTLTNSSNSAGVDVAGSGIFGGGIDSVQVGADLNANGVNYSYFVLWASAAACNGGWGCNGEYIPVEAAPPTTGPFPADPDTPPDDTATPPPPPPPPIDEPDLSVACVPYSQRSVNIALAHLGVSKQITDLAAEVTKEAVLSRLHLKGDIEATLRDFDWPFATRYLNLVLVAGTANVPAVPDWQYAYRLPLTCVKARRLVGQHGQGRAFDPDPIPFRIGSDDVGPLLYTNAVATTTTPLALEYTTRVLCPMLTGDVNFRTAVEWRHAQSLAMPLGRDNKMQAYCFARYVDALTRAETPAAQEQQQEPPGDADWIRGR